MKNIFILFISFFAVVACNAQKKSSGKAKKKIVLIPGKDSHGVGEHEHLGGCVLLAKLLNENVPGVTAYVTEQGWPVDTTILDDADAILMYSDGGDGHMVIPHIAHMDRLMKKGVGLMNLHYAVEISTQYGPYFLDWVGGYFEGGYSVNPFWTAKYESLPKLPVTSGVKPFETRDEWYYHMRFRENDKNLVPILKALPPAETLDRPDGYHSNNKYVKEDVLVKKIPQVMAWQYTRPNGGRGIGVTGAHTHSNWMNDDFRKLVLNSLCWVAKINIPANGINSATPTKEELEALQKKPK
jgi:hypothetical protein